MKTDSIFTISYSSFGELVCFEYTTVERAFEVASLLTSHTSDLVVYLIHNESIFALVTGTLVP